ncbi:efflux RND transporter periplasmic adaptor subunit [Mesobacterium sp. TK19101]|uniref:Efflux RND transporter periplasmic adaptor subunit n=1 Tax=Mesobacterium hydrothermale TaxID=3111907 RepID=A0ABU6HMB0_9RHOB|nr:efflux RND transporter periplasmic adaptor subunit [Mesobacterium sp. TK19101]MEC3862990.1 efflux RND transporter periplasmic adaptor subunit [Mesobacterium sp. TK19101]
MRFVPFITALIVSAVLFGLVMERDRLFQAARDLSPVSEPATPETPAEAAPAATETAQAAPDALPEGTVAVIAKRSVAQEIDSAVVLRGATEATRKVDVQAQTSGIVISEPLRRGALVTKDQVLCQIDPGTRDATLSETEAKLAEAIARRPEVEARIPEARARVAQARAQLDEALINANAATKLQEGGFASDTRVLSTQAAVRSAEAALSSAEAGVKSAQSGLDTLAASIQSAEAAVARARTDIDYLTITAPFAGLLENDTAELGSLLQSGGQGGASCAQILQIDPIKVVGYVPETEVGRIEVGARAGARLTDGRTVTGTVSFLSRSADPLTRTFRVEMTVANTDLSIREGQTAEIGIASDGVNAHLLPASSLTLNDEGTLGVRTIDADSKALFVPVTLIRDTRDGVWVTGLADTVDVITVGQEYVTDGVAVAPSFEEVIQ